METIERKVKDVAEPDQIASGMAGTGQENEKKTSASKKPIIGGSVRKVVRKTELKGFAVPSSMDRQETRKRTERDLKMPDPEIPYYAAEEALRDLVCAIMEREDRLYDDLYIRWNGMKHRIDALEDEVEALQGGRTEVRK